MTAAPFVLREATVEDTEALRDLAIRTFDEAFAYLSTPEDHQHYLSTAYAFDQLRREIEDPAKYTALAFPADDTSRPCGFVMLTDGSIRPGDDGPTEDYIEIKRIYSDSAFYGKGVSILLMQRAIEIAEQRKRRIVWLGVNQGNNRARRFYEKQNFEITGTRTFKLGAVVHSDWVYTYNPNGTAKAGRGEQ